MPTLLWARKLAPILQSLLWQKFKTLNIHLLYNQQSHSWAFVQKKFKLTFKQKLVGECPWQFYS